MFQFIFALFYWIRNLMEQQRHALNCSHPPSWWWWLSIQETLKFDLIQWLSLSLSVLTSKLRRVNSKSALEKMIQLSCLSESPTAQSSCAQPISPPYITFVTSCQAVYFSKTFRISTAMLWQFFEIKYVKIKIKWIKKMLCMTLFFAFDFSSSLWFAARSTSFKEEMSRKKSFQSNLNSIRSSSMCAVEAAMRWKSCGDDLATL